MEKERESFIKINFRKREVHAGFATVYFEQGGFQIMYIPSLGLSSYGDNKQEADEMGKEVVNEYFMALLQLPEAEAMRELREHGWERKPFLSKQLRNTQFLDVDAIREQFDLPKETQIRKEYVMA